MRFARALGYRLMLAVITLLLGEFPDLIAYGLRALLAEDDRVQVLASDVPIDSLEAAPFVTIPIRAHIPCSAAIIGKVNGAIQSSPRP